VIDIHGVPANAMLDMRASLRKSMSIKVAKKKLINLAWEDAGFDSELLEEMYGDAVQPALVQTSTFDSFELYSELKKTEAGRAAKPGDVATEDITIPKQDTGMAPGPIVGELNSIGIPAKIMKGSVYISKDTVVIREGEVFEGDLGLMLSKLGINPIVTGLRLVSSLEDGIRFTPDVLSIDSDAFRGQVIGAISATFNLACNIGWFTSTTVPALIAKASSEALSVAVEAGITNSKTLPMMMAKANASALGVAARLDSSALDDELATLLGAAANAAAESSATAEDAAADAPAEAAEEEEEEEEASFGGLGDLFG